MPGKSCGKGEVSVGEEKSSKEGASKQREQHEPGSKAIRTELYLKNNNMIQCYIEINLTPKRRKTNWHINKYIEHFKAEQ